MSAIRESNRLWSSHFLCPAAVGHGMVCRLLELHPISSAKKHVTCLFHLRLLTVTPRSRVLQKLNAQQLANKSHGSFLFSHKPVTCLYLQIPNQFSKYTVILSHLRRDIFQPSAPTFLWQRAIGITVGCSRASRRKLTINGIHDRLS
jgi:hypothetical protein